MVLVFNSYADDLNVYYSKAIQLSALRGCFESKNANTIFVFRRFLRSELIYFIVCNNFTLMRVASQEFSD